MVSNYEALAQYFGSPRVGPGANDIAKHILLNSEVGKPKGPGNVSSSSPSLVGRIFDVLSRGNYAVAEFAREWAQTGDPNLSAAWEGVTGRKKTTWKDALKEMGMEDKDDQAAIGFFLDVVADPLTYIPVAGLVNKGSRLFKGSEAVSNAASVEKATEKPLGQQILDKGEAVRPESFGLPERAAQPVPVALTRSGQPSASLTAPMKTQLENQKGFTQSQLQLDLPGIPPKLDTSTAKVAEEAITPVGKEVPGQQAFRFPGFSVAKEKSKAAEVTKLIEQMGEKATTTVSRVAAGDVLAASKLTPPPPPKVTPKQQVLADEILSKFNPEKTSAALNKKYPDTLNAKQQARLWYEARNAATKTVYGKGRSAASRAKAIDTMARGIYQAAESALIAAGKTPRIGTGETVRLSEIISDFAARGIPFTDKTLREFGSEIIPGSDLWKSIEAQRARGAIEDSTKIQPITNAVNESKAATKASNVLSDAETFDFDSFLKNFGANAAKAAGVSPAGIDSTKKLINEALQSGKTPAQIAVEQSSKILDEIIATGVANAQATKVLTRALEKDLGKLPTWALGDNKAVEWFMGRVATWWNQADLRPLSLNAIGSAAATAGARGKYLDSIFDGLTQAQRSDAFKLAQGALKTTADPATLKLASQITKLMDNMFSKVSGGSVLTRSGVSMDMLNKWLKYYKVGFQFSNKEGKTLAGQTVDYSNKTDWLDSWKTADITGDPKAFLFKAQQALEQATREKSLFDELGERFGSTVPGGAHRVKLEGYPYVKDYYFTADIAKQLPRVIKDWSTPAWSGAKSPLIGLYDRVLSMWKSGVTIYRPAHHIRNMVGDVYLGWMDGVNSVKPYILAAQVQKSMRGVYKDLQDIDKLVDMGALPRSYKTPAPNQVIFRNKSGTPFTAEQIGAVAHEKGLLEHARTIEDIIDMGEGSNKLLNIRPFGGKVQAVARGASELQSHNARLAHFIDKVRKSRGGNLEEIFEQASRRARKWHPTGLDLTEFERNNMRRIIPFYTWMRKSFPLMAEGLVMNPGKAVIPAKAYDALQHSQGIETPGRHDPFPVDQMFPQWIRDTGLGPLGSPGGFLASLTNQQPEGYAMAGMGLNPLTDTITQLAHPGKTIGGALTPALKIPMELLQGRENFTGAPITGIDAAPGAFGEYVGEQIPFVSVLQGITGTTPFGGDTAKSVKSDTAGREALVNFITGAGVRGTGPYVKQARYEREAPIDARNRANREAFLAELRRQIGADS